MQSFWSCFIGDLSLPLIGIIAILGCIISIKNNKKKNKIRFSILIIMLIPIIISFSISLILPEFKDIGYIVKNQLLVNKFTIKNVAVTGKINTFETSNGQIFRYDPWKFKPQQDKVYVLTYTPNSRFVINATISN